MTIRKPILCLDFDGVLHSYTSGWSGADVILDPPTTGAMAFILDAMEHFTVAIYSSRSNAPGGIPAMQEWLAMHMEAHVRKAWGLGGGELRESLENVLGAIQWPTTKPPALVTLDDRAVTFTGNFPGVEELRRFEPWTKTAERERQFAKLAETGATITGEEIKAYNGRLRSFVAEIDQLPDPELSLMTKNERSLVKLLKRIADALRLPA
jgi:hypothetical protein